MINSRSAGNFINHATTIVMQIPSTINNPLKLSTTDSGPIGKWVMHFSFRAVVLCTSSLYSRDNSLPCHWHLEKLILGIPWLQQHDPNITWTSHKITMWSDYCKQHCLEQPQQHLLSISVESPDVNVHIEIPANMRNSKICSVRPWLLIFLHTASMTVLSTSFLAQPLHESIFTLCPLQNRKPSRNMFRRSSSRDILNLPLLLLLDFSLWRKRTNALYWLSRIEQHYNKIPISAMCSAYNLVQ